MFGDRSDLFFTIIAKYVCWIGSKRESRFGQLQSTFRLDTLSYKMAALRQGAVNLKLSAVAGSPHLRMMATGARAFSTGEWIGWTRWQLKLC